MQSVQVCIYRGVPPKPSKPNPKKVVSDNLALVDFAIGLVNSVLNLPDKQVKFFLGNSKDRRTDVITPALQKSLGANF